MRLGPSKTCKTCGQLKPQRDFYTDYRNADGLVARCKECHRATKLERKVRREKSEARLRLVRQHPCLICQDPAVQAHHLMFAQASAMGARSGDQFAVPLCATHHQQLHADGNETRWWTMQGVDPMAWLQWLEALDGGGDEA